MNGTDEFGGILVDDEQDEFGGVLVGEEPSRVSAPAAESKPVKKTGLLDVGLEEWAARKLGLGPAPKTEPSFISPTPLPGGGFVGSKINPAQTAWEGPVPFLPDVVGSVEAKDIPLLDPEGKPAAYTAEAINQAMGLGQFMTSPIAWTGAGAIGKIPALTTGAALIADIIRHMPEIARTAGKVSVSPTATPQEKARAYLNMAVPAVLPAILPAVRPLMSRILPGKPPVKAQVATEMPAPEITLDISKPKPTMPAVEPAKPASGTALEKESELRQQMAEDVGEASKPFEVLPAPEPVPVVEAAKSAETMTPAVMIKGEPVLGKAGETHDQIKERVKASDPEDAKGLFEAAVMVDANKDHVFVDESGKILNREEAASKFDRLMGNDPGTTKRLHSQDLANLPTPEPAKPSGAPSETAAPKASESAPLQFWGYDSTTGEAKWKKPQARGFTQVTSEQAAKEGLKTEAAPTREEWDRGSAERMAKEREGAARSAAMFAKPKPVEAAPVEAAAADVRQHISSTPKPDFKKFLKEGVAKHGPESKPALEKAWKDNIFLALEGMKGEELATMRDRLYGSSEAEVRRLSVEREAKGIKIPDSNDAAAGAVSISRRATLMREISDKLTGGTEKPKPDLNRTTLTPDDIGWGVGSDEFVDIDPTEPRGTLGRRFTANGRLRGEPETITRRVAVVQDSETGEVLMLSAYSPGKPGAEPMIVDPAKAGNKRPHVTIRELFSRKLPNGSQQYTPVGSVLLSEPVRGFKQRFESLDAWNEQFGNNARSEAQSRGTAAETMREASTQGVEPEAPPEPFEAKFDRPVTDVEAGAVYNHFAAEDVRSPADVSKAFNEMFEERKNIREMAPALRDNALVKSRARRMDVISGALAKIARRFESEGFQGEEALAKTFDWIYEKLGPEGTAQTRGEFVKATLGRFAEEAEGVPGRSPAGMATPPAAQKLKMQEGPVAPEAVRPEPARAPQALGITPPGSETLQEIVSRAISKPKGVAPPIKTDVSTPLPDFQEYGAAKKIFSQPFGFERLPVLGALFGGVRRLSGFVNESLATYWAERQVGRSVASALGNEYRWIDEPFTVKDGQITNIEPTREGQSLYISDVFEGLQRNPNAYRLNPEQQKSFDAIQALEKDFSRLEKKYELGKVADAEGAEGAVGDASVYFPRIVTSRPGGVVAGLRRGQAVGGKVFFEKSRMFATEAEGWAKGFKYEPSIVGRIATRAERLYKRMADKRLAGDEELGGLSRKELEAQLKESYSDELASGTMTEAKISQIVDSLEARGRVFQPAFFNRIFPEETANLLNKAFPNSSSGLRQFAASVNNALKGLKLGFDLGVGFIQGQGIIARHPQIWAKSQMNSMKAMFSPEFFPEYVRRNLEPIRELAQLGSSVGHLEEYMAGLGRREILGRLPVLGTASRAFGRQFSTFLDTAKVEMWKGLRETTPREQWSDVVQSLESVLQSGRMEAVGISGRRALTERALLMAPAYYRGGLNLIAAMGERGVAGQVARRAMGAYALGGMVMFYGVAKALGMSDDDILRRTNPARADFMMWRVRRGNRASEVGFGGFYRSLLRLMGKTAQTSVENPGNWKSLDPKKNPFTQWYRSHAGPVVGLTWDMFSGKDFMGEDADVRSIPRAMLPLAVETLRQKPGQPKPTALDAVTTATGMAKYPSPTPAQDVARKAARYMEERGLRPKMTIEFSNDPSYRTLRQAVQNDDKESAQKIVVELRKTKPLSQIIKVMKAHSVDEFTDAGHEKDFIRSMSQSDRDLYWQARQQRKEELGRFFQMLP